MGRQWGIPIVLRQKLQAKGASVLPEVGIKLLRRRVDEVFSIALNQRQRDPLARLRWFQQQARQHTGRFEWKLLGFSRSHPAVVNVHLDGDVTRGGTVLILP